MQTTELWEELHSEQRERSELGWLLGKLIPPRRQVVRGEEAVLPRSGEREGDSQIGKQREAFEKADAS